MSIIQVQNISKSFGTHVLFEGVSFQIAENDRVGLIGPNGCGKTTLLSILNQESEPDSGSVIVSRNCRRESIVQITDADFDGSLYEIALNAREDLLGMERDISVLERRLETETEGRDRMIRRMCDLRDRYESESGLTYRSRVRSTLMGLGFEPDELERPYRSFSGGEIRKAHLARLLLSEPNLLVLDEPTNHLDILSTEWLEDYLAGYRGAIITVSHDRRFLDKVTSRTLEIRNRRLTERDGPRRAAVSLRVRGLKPQRGLQIFARGDALRPRGGHGDGIIPHAHSDVRHDVLGENILRRIDVCLPLGPVIVCAGHV